MRGRRMFRPSRVGVATLVLQLFVTPGEAATLTFEVLNADWINVVGGNVTQDTAGNDTADLGWGVTGSSIRSQFRFDGTDTLSPIPTDTLFEIGTFRHTNNPLLGATTGIDSAQLSLTATLTYIDGSSTSVFPGAGLLLFRSYRDTQFLLGSGLFERSRPCGESHEPDFAGRRALYLQSARLR